MKLLMFAVLDAKTGFFSNPFYEHREEGALRSFSDAVNDGSNTNNQWYRHPEDFALYVIGSYETETALLEPLQLRCLVTATSLKKEVRPAQLDLFNGREKTPVG